MDMDKKNMLERVVKAARKAYMKGFAAGSGGNVSIRIQGQVYISPSGICLGDLTQEDMIMLEADGFATPADKPDSGRRRPPRRPECIWRATGAARTFCACFICIPLFHCGCLPQAGKRESGHGHACLHSGIRHACGKDSCGSLLPSRKPGTGRGCV